MKAVTVWLPKWRSRNKLDGVTEQLIVFHHQFGLPVGPFKTRAACKDWIDEWFGYIKDRKDLRNEPHGWRLPVPVKVSIKEIKR